MVILHEAIPTKRQIDERIARAASATAFRAIESQQIPASLMAADGLSYDKLTPAHWREIAVYQEPELYFGESSVMPFSEEALGEAF